MVGYFPRWLMPLFAPMISLGFVGCSALPQGVNTCVYVSNAGAATFSALLFDRTTETFSTTATYVPIAKVLAIRFHPIYKTVFVATFGGKVQSYTMTPSTCALTDLTSTAIANSTNLFFNYLGSFAYVVDNSQVYPYLADGTAGTLVGPADAAGSGSVITSHVSGSFVFLGDPASGKIYSYQLGGSTGSLANGTNVASGLTAGAGILDMTTTPNGKYLYGTDGTNLEEYSIDAYSGDLTLVSTTGVGTTSRSIVISPNGYTAVVANTGSNTVKTYLVSVVDGSLSLKQSYATNTPYAGAFESTGSYFFVTNNATNNVTAYGVSGSKFTAIAAGAYAVGAGPTAIAAINLAY